MTQDTAAPWFIAGDFSTVMGIYDQRGRIAMIDEESPLSDEELMQAAKLMEAAPLMLAALQRITHPAADDTDHENALQVIAQATGEHTS